MKQINQDALKPFQLKASGDLVNMLSTYPSPLYKIRYNPDTGLPYPFLCRLKAITGSGKTPILASALNLLSNSIILWTTNRGAVISQTKTNLSSGGKYSSLLPIDVQVIELKDLSMSEWYNLITAKSGVTIVLATVALFNQEGDILNVHKDRGGTSYWEMLSGNGPDKRNRPLYVVYDEAHGGTKAQFTRLTELNPSAFILASATKLPESLEELLPGKTIEEKSKALDIQTVKVNTKDVVATGLLKTRLYLVDCNTTRIDALKEANDKWLYLSKKLAKFNELPIMCAIVNSTLAGLEIWEILTQHLKVDPTRVAVHLSNVEKHFGDLNPNTPWGQLVDTHKAGKTPENLKDDGYTHVIWNLSLREGWDEPWAYVAYIDGKGKSNTDMSQKIGRFLRQPNAEPFDDWDLNSAYFYFNVPDEDFSDLVTATQHELEDDGYEIITVSSSSSRPSNSFTSKVLKDTEIDIVSVSFGDDPNILDQILLNNTSLFAAEALKSPGKVLTRVLDLRNNNEDDSLKSEEHRNDNAEIKVWNFLIDRLAALDSRIAQKNGNCFTPFVKDDPKMKQTMQFGSQAMLAVNSSLINIQQQLNTEFRLEYEADQRYSVKPFNLVSPNLMSDDDKKREFYRVRTYVNAIHLEYNGMNAFEVKISEALDKLNLKWCRNPSKVGYSIPIPEIGLGTTNFYPDFLLWSNKCLWAIDPKGEHLLNDAIYSKLLGVADIEGLAIKIRVAFLVEGTYVLSNNDRPLRQNKEGYSIIWKERGKVRVKHFLSCELLVNELK
nr:DEAD/DEAH box helicase family protein [uncultured Pedobacter sp.]